MRTPPSLRTWFGWPMRPLTVMWMACILAFLLCADECSSRSAPAPQAPAAPPSPAPPPPTAADAKLADAIAADQKAESDAKTKGSKLAELEAQLKEATDRIDQAKNSEKEWYAARDVLTAEVTAERNHVLQVKAYWISGILFLLGLGGAIVAIWIPLARLWAERFAIACGGGGVLAIVFALAVPYLVWVGVGLGVLGVGYLILMWRKDHHALLQHLDVHDQLSKTNPEIAKILQELESKTLSLGSASRIAQLRDWIGSELKTVLTFTKA